MDASFADKSVTVAGTVCTFSSTVNNQNFCAVPVFRILSHSAENTLGVPALISQKVDFAIDSWTDGEYIPEGTI